MVPTIPGTKRQAPWMLVAILAGVVSGSGCASSPPPSEAPQGTPEAFSLQKPPEVVSEVRNGAFHPERVASATVDDAEPPEVVAKLMIYGGRGRDIYLGCLNCEGRTPESIFNELGPYGSPDSPYSIYNPACEYGSVASPLSPLNPRATHPPVIIDQGGRFYGYLTINEHMPRAFRDDHVDRWLKRVHPQP